MWRSAMEAFDYEAALAGVKALALKQPHLGEQTNMLAMVFNECEPIQQRIDDLRRQQQGRQGQLPPAAGYAQRQAAALERQREMLTDGSWKKLRTDPLAFWLGMSAKHWPPELVSKLKRRRKRGQPDLTEDNPRVG